MLDNLQDSVTDGGFIEWQSTMGKNISHAMNQLAKQKDKHICVVLSSDIW